MLWRKLFGSKAKESYKDFISLKSKYTYTHGFFEGSDDAVKLEYEDVEFFPQPESVFSDDLNGELKAFCSFYLEDIFSGLSGKAAFVYTYREYDKYPANNWYNEYCNDYILGFKLEHNNKIKLLGERELFGCSKTYLKYKDDSIKDFYHAKRLYKEKGNSFIDESIKLSSILRQLGSKPIWSQSDETPNIKDIEFIGQFDSRRFIKDGPYLFLFYDSKKRIYYQIEQYN